MATTSSSTPGPNQNDGDVAGNDSSQPGFPAAGKVTLRASGSDESPPQDILIIDDEEAYRQLIGTILATRGYQIHLAANCKQAEEFLKHRTESPPLVITDWNMPDGEGIELVRRLKRDPRGRYLPVVMCTGRSQLGESQRGSDAGAYFYITKPIDGRVLTTAVAAAIRSYEPVLRQLAQAQHDVAQVLPLIQEVKIEFRAIEEAMNLARWVSRFFPDAEGARLGLQELFYNAIEHGNLGINYKEKSELLQNAGGFRAEILRRMDLAEFRSRKVRLTVTNSAEYAECVVEDEGEGFDFRGFLHLTPERALDMHGKGIAIANNVVFDELEYIHPGNVVRARMYRPGVVGANKARSEPDRVPAR